MKYATLTVRFSVIKESDNMDLKRELTDYEIGGIGDIKNTPSGSIHTELEPRMVS